MKILLTFVLLVSIFALPMFPANPNIGTAGAQFLKIPIGARAVSLGGAFIGHANDANAIFWNPAGIANVNASSVHFAHMRWFDMFDVNAAAYVQNFGSLGNFGVGVVVFSMDEIEMTTEQNPNGTGRFYDAQDLALSFGYARFLTDQFRVGLNIKYINQRIWNETASGIAFDIGTQYQIGFQNLIIAMSMSNFGADISFVGPDLNVNYDGDQFLQNRLLPTSLETELYPLPLNFQFGLAFDVYQTPVMHVRAGIDAVHPNDNHERLQFGSEIMLFDRFALRGGMKFQHDSEDFNFGIGVNSYLGTFLLKLDYAYSGYDLLPDVHFISVGFDF